MTKEELRKRKLKYTVFIETYLGDGVCGAVSETAGTFTDPKEAWEVSLEARYDDISSGGPCRIEVIDPEDETFIGNLKRSGNRKFYIDGVIDDEETCTTFKVFL